MVALTIGLVVSGAVFSLFIANKETYRITENLARMQDDARVAFELLGRSVRATEGIVCGRVPVYNVLNNSTTQWWSNWAGSRIRGYSGSDAAPRAFGTNPTDRVNGTDALYVLGAAQQEPAIVIGHNPSGSPPILTTNSSHRLQVGDVVAICDGMQATLFQINGVPTATTITHAAGGGPPGNCTDRLNESCGGTSGGPPKQFPAGAQITRLDAELWYIGHNNRNGRSLYRLRMNQGNVIAEEMLPGIHNMQLSYLTSDGANPPNLDNQFRPAAAITDWNRVVGVRVALTLQSAERVDASGNAIQRQSFALFSIRAREYLP
ncbi:Type IV Pilus-assembly protein W [Tepidimonas charontis]|uniref:Type IV Pilus-assembly protein W n=2 Tax=Tepidimonas charontis TaxID=2267262 RepID=A0A554XFT0_9BURK|nr:Type IV Pilus-assembly protein W [Tepidimonas charontis]